MVWRFRVGGGSTDDVCDGADEYGMMMVVMIVNLLMGLGSVAVFVRGGID